MPPAEGGSSSGPGPRFEEFGNGRTRIIVTELPYQVNKGSLIENIAEQVKDKRLEGISDLRDESDRERYAHRHRAEKGRQPAGGLEPPVRPDPAADHLRRQSCWRWYTTRQQPKILSLRHILDEYI